MIRIWNIMRSLFAAIGMAMVLTALCSAADDEGKGHVNPVRLDEGMRVEFSWDTARTVPFTLDSDGKHVSLHFEKPVKIEWNESLKTLSPYIDKVETQKGGTVVTLTLARPAETRYFMSYGKSGIDLVERDGLPHPIIVGAAPKKHKHFAKAKTSKKPATIASNSPAAPTLATLSPAAGRESEATATPKSPVREEFLLPLKPSDRLAVFVKQKTLWIIADSDSRLSLEALTKSNSHFVKSVHVLPDTHSTILYAPLGVDAFATVVRMPDASMELVLNEEPGKLAETLTPAPHINAAKQASLIVAASGSDVVSFHDPASNEDLSVALLAQPGSGVATEHPYKEFVLLPSAQGIVLQKLSDDVTLAAHRDEVEIASSKGLALPPEMIEQAKKAEADALSHLSATLFPYGRWKLENEKNFTATEVTFFHDIAYAATPEEANKLRMKLLGLYLAEGLFPEARGMADDILRTSYKFYRDNKVAALRGAAYFFSYRITEAERDFSSPELAGNAEAAMWLSLCKELLGESAVTFNFVANYDRFISSYPPIFIQKLAIIAADRAITRKEYDVANTIFDTLKKDNLEEPVAKYIAYMHAKILSETQNEEEAVKIWQRQAELVNDPLIRARAEFSLVNLLLRQDKITHADAINRLDKLRIVWRGDSLELNTLLLLGDLYVEDKQYAKALHTFRDVVLYYPEMPEAVNAAKKMEEAFVTLYNKGAADTMPPLEALSLFYEFRDLVPVGEQGDQMIRNLADRLVGIDLLDRAALLLDHQIQKRLQGAERSRVGARLALIYLMNHQPKEALETLKTTGYGDLPPDLQLTRIHLTAQALAERGEVDKAIEVLSSDNSAEGNMLRLSIYWDNKDWPHVVSTAEEILGNRNDPSAMLTSTESDVLLKLATAYVYEHDTGQIQYLRDYFTPLLKKSATKDSFLFVTSESGTIDYETLANLDQDINSVRSFLDAYRENVKKNGLSHAI